MLILQHLLDPTTPLTPHPHSLHGRQWQKDKSVRRHSTNVLRYFTDTEELHVLSVRSKRLTMDFSLLSVAENAPEQPNVSHQVHEN